MSVADPGELAIPVGHRTPFAPRHRADAVFFPSILVFLWVGLAMGFGPRIAEHLAQATPYLPIVRVHAFIFVVWMLLLTTQLVLIRSGNVGRHRQLGKLGFFWAPLLVAIGLATSVMVDQSFFGTKRWDPAFFSIQLADLVNFALITGFALAMRRDGAAHKRLMLLGTIAICNAGFSRWWAPSISSWLGDGYFGAELLQDFLGDFVCIGLVLMYDAITRGKPHPLFVRASCAVIGIEMFAVYAYLAPWWGTLTDRLLHP